MAVNLGKFLHSLACAIVFCTYEYPSDPLASQQVSFRSARVLDLQENIINNADNAYDFSKGSSNPIASTKSGKVEGYIMTSIKGRSIYAFEGIPYAETTAGINRFELPIPKRPWSGVRPAKKPGDYCIQIHLLRFPRILGSEDCLYLNVYVPADPILQGKKNLPVIVFFHGGSFFFGAGSEYGPSYLLEHDVILVTVNYRLGILGFLSTGDEHMPGNLGLKDQRSSLEWVQENILNFGGDPGVVTLAGQSGGAASVHLHMLSNSSRNLFSGAISMSGSAFSPWAHMNTRNREDKNRKLAKATNCPLGNSKAFVDCLRKIDGRMLVRSMFILWEFPPLPVPPPVPLGYVIEDDRPGAFITEHPDEAYAGNRVAPVPWIISRTANEMEIVFTVIDRTLAVVMGSRRKPLRSLLERLAPSLFDYQYVIEKPDNISNRILQFYLGTPQPNVPTNFTTISEAITDRFFGYIHHKSAQIHSTVAPTYASLYSYQGRNSVGNALGFNEKDLGVSHIDDLASFFNMSDGFHGYKTTDPEYAVVKLMTSMMYNFASTRVPLFEDDEGIARYIWTPVEDPQNIRLLQIDQKVKMIPEPLKERFKFWETLGLKDMKPFIPIED